MRSVLLNYFRAAYPAVAIQTTEEARASGEVLAAARELDRKVVSWSAIEGMIAITDGARKLEGTEDLLAACSQRMEDTIYILRDPHTWPFDRDPILCRALRDFIAAGPARGSTVVILAPEFRPHPTFEKMVVVLDYSLPGPEHLQLIAQGIAASAGGEPGPVHEDVIRALGGLTTTEAENALALAWVESKFFDPEVIYREKCKAVKRSGLLDIVDPDPRGLDAVGGLDALKAWIGRRKRVWSPEAEAFGLPQPKGILLVGVPGTGKSLAAKSIGTALRVPTLRLDIGALFNSLVGESESRTREALKLAEALAPCVLWVDEIDKGLAGSGGSGGTDGGVTKRVFGTIISWMQDRLRPVFLVATANDVTSLPPEFLRKGRFDELFAVDLPTQLEREVIFAIHLKARKREPAEFDLAAAAAACERFTGSEIEATLNEALFAAFDDDRPLVTADLVAAAAQIVPLAVTAKEQVEAIRAWASGRARFASRPPMPVVSLTPPPGRKFRAGKN
jgi:hypothetical protein